MPLWRTLIGRIQWIPVLPSQMCPVCSVFMFQVCVITWRTNRCVLSSSWTQFCFAFLVKIFGEIRLKTLFPEVLKWEITWTSTVNSLRNSHFYPGHQLYGLYSKQTAPDLFPETHNILFRAIRLFDVGVLMRLNILHFQNCFGFYCLALVILWENKVIKDNVFSELRVWKTEAIFKEFG